MAETIDRGTLDRLMALGRTRGELTTDELRAELPIDDMDVDALVLVMLELDAAGVSVEPETIGPRQDQRIPSTFELLAPPTGAQRAAKPVGDTRTPAVAVPSPPEAVGVRVSPGVAAEEDAVGRVVLLSGLAVFFVLGAILVLL